MSAVTCSSLLRALSSRFSITCVRFINASKPKIPLPPLIEWAALKMLLSSSGSGASTSRLINSCSISSRCSSLSSKNTLWNCSISMLILNPSRELNGRVNYPNTRFVTSNNLFGSNGFTIQPVAPAALPFAFISSPASVVNITTGVRA